MTDLSLVVTARDVNGRMTDAVHRWIGDLRRIFGPVGVLATSDTVTETLEPFGELVRKETEPPGVIGRSRHRAVELAVAIGASHTLIGELDRMLHWAHAFEDELASMRSVIDAWDLTVLGRTERAFATHPEMQTVTEGIVNDVWSRVTGDAWDVMVGVRGMSLAVAQALVDRGPVVDGVETDVIWPLWAKREGFSVGYVATEGLEFETADRFGPEVEVAGGPEAWQRTLDADPSRWARRLEFARRSVEAIARYE